MVVRRARGWLLAALALLSGCGGEERVDPAGRGWPLTFEVPAVLGYAAGRADGGLVRVLRAVGGWILEGTDPQRAELLLLLDPTVLGAPLGLALPVSDQGAFATSLAACPGVEVLGDDRYRLTLPPDHPIRRALLMLQAGPSLRSMGDVMSMLSQLAPLTLTFQLSFRSGYALLVPSFEATLVARQVLEALPLDALGLGEVALGIDVERVRDTWHDEIEQASQQVRALVTGAQTAGLAGMLLGAASMRGGSAIPRLPVSGECLWALVRMQALDDVGAAGVRVAGLVFDDDGVPAWTPGQSGRIELRTRRVRSSAYTELLASLESTRVPPVGAALAADPAAFRAAVRSWCEPLAVSVKGEGPPAARWLERLAELLEPWSGRVEMRAQLAEDHRLEGIVLGVGVLPGERFDGAGWSDWCEELFDGAALDPEWRPDLSAGAGEGVTLLSRDEALVAFPADADADVITRMADALFSEPLPATGPVMAVAIGPVSFTVEVEGLDVVVAFEFEPTSEVLGPR